MLEIISSQWPSLLSGLWNTILCSVIALIGSLIIGTFFALLEISKYKVIRIIGSVYVEVFRNIPLLVIAMAFFLIVPMYFTKISGFTAGTIGLTLYTSAFIAETVRAGINSVEAGQLEGALANGLTTGQAMRYIILPQAFKVIIPPLGNQFINLVKNSSVLAFVAGFDLMYEGNMIANDTLQTIPTYFIVGIMYLIITLPLSYYMRHLEKKLA
ncbi:amino acid ABC superfamily ATP binding cassette transporter, membrane protein [Limosilactobacillus frumenti DSM 13145]|uniref:Amino acid ABC superfamily ATP binding cassette transporter, membrane protein n=1 Tax=Limosilactobacillus frumenti DSM 13145 TaxID=1423746 RepID=A0A0R1PHP2_9LACO|nr:amino acid ABC transporter permease [Limosilactobacillus frumenti]KRL28056.1 amino acid ABC superfamily ATP binding cassette transporter, membrane protein [Limosilactobacillus frumenti DSM 13145]MBA2913451.1 amino acid ABC transporter permease [Limosilactobacillus frumenti]QFG73117.1 amino acid ABC transporter permease [Limosilactobacillus frumenti]